MRIFVYKVLVSVVSIFFLYHLTFGHTIYKFQNKLYSSFDKESIDDVKQKIREELKNSLEKDQILDKEDAILLKKIFKKISLEINNAE